ncbi:DUF6465 family protein [Roseburia sp. 499]|uniref:DUF6465 family protein n=1 Tax=Roseburia sp. 499 TaxID=1261634 RepID=UPI000951DB21|nr:DUF6465 family protein [Roseburia sp. 499]WVK70069.1 DUF6465 family protein [Roseburia sp. 499]
MARKCSVERAQNKAGGFAKAKKRITIQYQGRERLEENLLHLIKKAILEQGVKDEDIMEVDVYVKPEEQAVFYVVNKEISGQIGF